jgi:hypothetical protein
VPLHGSREHLQLLYLRGIANPGEFEAELLSEEGPYQVCLAHPTSAVDGYEFWTIGAERVSQFLLLGLAAN